LGNARIALPRLERDLQRKQQPRLHRIRNGALMKYLAICFLALTALFSTAGTASIAPAATTSFAPSFIEPAVSLHVLRHSVDSGDSKMDGTLMVLLAGALITLQLRRRQKSLRMPRMLIT
jgi:hypothetical protein